jgi:pyruvate,water dikinase
VRTVPEAQEVVEVLKKNGLTRGEHALELYMMVEIPSNVLLIDEFAQHFDGFSIGSNDLTQLTLGVDRDSGLLTKLFDERDPAVLKMLSMAVQGAKKSKTYIGICGQAPSDFPEIAQFLINEGINSLSLTPDSVIPFLMKYKK